MMWVLDMVVVGMAVAAGFYLGWQARDRKHGPESLCDGCEKLMIKREHSIDGMHWFCSKNRNLSKPVLYCCDYKQRGGGDDQGV